MGHLNEILHVGLAHFLVLSAILFSLGAFTLVSRKNAVGMLIGVELILNSANVNLVAFSHYITGHVGGQVFALFVMLVNLLADLSYMLVDRRVLRK